MLNFFVQMKHLIYFSRVFQFKAFFNKRLKISFIFKLFDY
jgi:hypothetical protein